MLRAVDTRRYPRAENRIWSDQQDHKERWSKDLPATIFQQENAHLHTARVAKTSYPMNSNLNEMIKAPKYDNEVYAYNFILFKMFKNIS